MLNNLLNVMHIFSTCVCVYVRERDQRSKLNDPRKTVELLEFEENHYLIMRVKYIILQ